MAENILYSKNQTRPIHSTNGNLIIGNCGSGTNSWMEQNLKAMTDSNIIVIDPQGMPLRYTQKDLKENGYTVKVLDFMNPETFTGDNPLLLLCSDREISDFVTLFFRNVPSETDNTLQLEAEKSLLKALILVAQREYCKSETEKRKYNLVSVFEKLESLKTKDDIAALFTAAAMNNAFAHLSENVIDAIKLSLAIRLSFCKNADIAKFLSASEVNFANINGNNEKTALFVVTPILNSTYQWLHTQVLHDLLKYVYFDKSAREREKTVRVFINNASDIGKIPMLDKFIADAQYHGVVFDIVFQSFKQIEAVYSNEKDALISNMNMVYLCSSSYFDDEFLRTIASYSCKSLSRMKLIESIEQLNVNKCLLMLDGLPIVDEKLSIEYTENMDVKEY